MVNNIGLLKRYKKALQTSLKEKEEEDNRIFTMYEEVAEEYELRLGTQAEHIGFFNPGNEVWGEVSFYHDITKEGVIARLKEQGVIR